MKHKLVRSIIICTTVLAVFSFVQQGQAELVSPVSISGMVMGEPDLGTFMYAPSLSEFDQDGDAYTLTSSASFDGAWMNSADIVINDIMFDADPIVYNNILVANTSGGTQTYQFLITLPTTWSAGQIRGSIDTSVIGQDALLNAPSGGSVYTALIDGGSVKTLQDDAFALGTSQAATSQSDQFTWEPSAIPVTTDIGIQLTFTLSDGATAAIISDFEAIPEPASLGLLGLVSGGIFFTRRIFAV